ncbi:hypothetical protein ACFQFH_07900 [Halobaculum halobium]|uniref:SipW-cognate class signal peptide n=1 Tax=Halobaculum halobium TaxID=3032281 RepID=A0ABD5T8W0_9EURY|nr:hypothetical protein [Halobaculum sp. SYNS20]
MGRTALRVVLLVVIAAGVSGATVGSAGFSAVEADRTVSVNVVGNDEAYVGVVACEKSANAGNGKGPVRVWVTNRYTDEMTVESITSDDAVRRNPDQRLGTVDPGEREHLNPVFASAVSSVTVEVSADGLDASVTRTVTSKTDCPFSTGNANGKTNASTTATGTATNASG